MSKRLSGRLGVLIVLGLGLTAVGPAYAFNMGDFMNPGRWVGGNKDRDRDHGHDRYGPPGYYQGGPQGFGPHGQVPYGYGQMPYGQMPHGQMPYGQMPYGQPPYGQMPHWQTPPSQAPQWGDFGQMPHHGQGWPQEQGPHGFGGPFDFPGSPGQQPGFGPPPGAMPESFFQPPSAAPDDRAQQRIRELEMRLEQLERRQRDESDRGRPPAPVYPPLGL